MDCGRVWSHVITCDHRPKITDLTVLTLEVTFPGVSRCGHMWAYVTRCGHVHMWTGWVTTGCMVTRFIILGVGECEHTWTRVNMCEHMWTGVDGYAHVNRAVHRGIYDHTTDKSKGFTTLDLQFTQNTNPKSCTIWPVTLINESTNLDHWIWPLGQRVA